MGGSRGSPLSYSGSDNFALEYLRGCLEREDDNGWIDQENLLSAFFPPTPIKFIFKFIFTLVPECGTALRETHVFLYGGFN